MQPSVWAQACLSLWMERDDGNQANAFPPQVLLVLHQTTFLSPTWIFIFLETLLHLVLQPVLPLFTLPLWNRNRSLASGRFAYCVVWLSCSRGICPSLHLTCLWALGLLAQGIFSTNWNGLSWMAQWWMKSTFMNTYLGTRTKTVLGQSLPSFPLFSLESLRCISLKYPTA